MSDENYSKKPNKEDYSPITNKEYDILIEKYQLVVAIVKATVNGKLHWTHEFIKGNKNDSWDWDRNKWTTQVAFRKVTLVDNLPGGKYLRIGGCNYATTGDFKAISVSDPVFDLSQFLSDSLSIDDDVSIQLTHKEMLAAISELI